MVFQFAFVVIVVIVVNQPKLFRQIIIIPTVNNVRLCGVNKGAGFNTTFLSEKRQ